MDARGKKTFETAQTLVYIRCEVAKQNAFTALGDYRNDKLVLFYDCNNSLPADIVFTAEDVVTFNNVDYTVRDVTHEYDDVELHHYEVYLV